MHGQLTGMHQPGNMNKLASQASFKDDIPATMAKKKKDILSLPKAVMLMHGRNETLGAKQKAGRKRKVAPEVAPEVAEPPAKRVAVAPRITPYQVTIKAAENRRKAQKKAPDTRRSRRGIM